MDSEPPKDNPKVIDDEGKELQSVVWDGPDVLHAARGPGCSPISRIRSVMRLGKPAWELAIHMPHLWLATAIQDGRLVFGV